MYNIYERKSIDENPPLPKPIHNMIKLSIELITMKEFILNHLDDYTQTEQEFCIEIINENIQKTKNGLDLMRKKRTGLDS